jgi:hypothetical protein
LTPDLRNFPDGVHLTAEGNLLAAKHIAPILHKLLTGKQAKPSRKSLYY